jgi:hypothetical protein
MVSCLTDFPRSLAVPAEHTTLATHALAILLSAWPVYSVEEPRNFVFEQNVTSHAEADRAKGIGYINELLLARRGTGCTRLEVCSVSLNE